METRTKQHSFEISSILIAQHEDRHQLKVNEYETILNHLEDKLKIKSRLNKTITENLHFTSNAKNEDTTSKQAANIRILEKKINGQQMKVKTQSAMIQSMKDLFQSHNNVVAIVDELLARLNLVEALQETQQSFEPRADAIERHTAILGENANMNLYKQCRDTNDLRQRLVDHQNSVTQELTTMKQNYDAIVHELRSIRESDTTTKESILYLFDIVDHFTTEEAINEEKFAEIFRHNQEKSVYYGEKFDDIVKDLLNVVKMIEERSKQVQTKINSIEREGEGILATHAALLTSFAQQIQVAFSQILDLQTKFDVTNETEEGTDQKIHGMRLLDQDSPH
ncbi:hypothetical protein [Parasitella parasitica]|uniref:Uncharacterized protein n=1 Tax=Parasitella parasitica TaxID=35722 RepID=A0A0B7N1Y5_9FUNG|nr:hypothetical protein [Parasitella parasitica]